MIFRLHTQPSPEHAAPVIAAQTKNVEMAVV
jgi:hypothetical protein